MEAKEIKKRIKREKPNKKWSEEEVKSILNYIQEAPEIEAPTAQIFYKKFIERSGIAATWELIRWKVRHLKTCFKKADDWRKSTGAGLLDTDAGTSSVEGKVLQMCPHYKQLNEIFGEKNVNGDFVVIDSGDVTIIDDSIIAELAEPVLESSFFIDTVDIPYDVEEVINPSPPAVSSDIRETETSSPAQASVITQGPSTSKKAKDFAEKLKKNAPKSSAAHLAIFQAERTEMLKIKLEWEKEKHEKELALSERKLNLEEEKVKREIDQKELELQKDERLKILQMEKDERIQKYEIEMKYKFQSQK